MANIEVGASLIGTAVIMGGITVPMVARVDEVDATPDEFGNVVRVSMGRGHTGMIGEVAPGVWSGYVEGPMPTELQLHVV